jgi:drug/metabolite transporter (DMT)-like permease
MSIAIGNRHAGTADFVTAAMAGAFVILWSSGFIGARLGLPYAGPFTFLALRFLLAGALLLPFVLLWKAQWPQSWSDVGHIAFSGLLLNCGCLGACFYALSLGLPAGVVAVIGGLQPLLTGVLAAAFLRERVTMRQWLGLFLGFGGVVLVLSDRLGVGHAPALAVIAAFIGLGSITLATIYQKRFCANVPLWSGAAIQLTASSAAMVAIGAAVEGFAVRWSLDLVVALLWLAVALSIGALTLLWALVGRGAASKVSSLFYLTPPTTAIMGWLFFGERLGVAGLLGMSIVVAGVALATRARNQPATIRKAG